MDFGCHIYILIGACMSMYTYDTYCYIHVRSDRYMLKEYVSEVIHTVYQHMSVCVYMYVHRRTHADR